MYKTKIKEIEINDVRKHVDYHKAIQWVVHANEHLSDSSHKFDQIIETFPKVKFNRLSEEAVFNIDKNVIGFMMLDVKINDKVWKFLLDTGAQISCVSETIARESDFELSKDKIEVGDAGGYKTSMSLACSNTIELLNLKITHLPVVVLRKHQLQLKVLGQTLYKVDGIIGWDVLNCLDFSLDYSKQLIAVHAIKSENIVNFVKSDFPTILVEEDEGRLLKFGLDLGAKKSWLNNEFIMKSSLKIKKVKKQVKYGFNGQIHEKSYVINRFGVKLHNSYLKFKNIESGYTGLLNDYAFDGVFGIDIIKNHKLVVLNSQGILYLEKPKNRYS